MFCYIQYLPWGKSRPYTNSRSYNSLMLEAEMRLTGNPHYESQRVNVYDEDERTTFCPLCRLHGKVIGVRIRGMCQESPLDTVYQLTLSEEGRIWYLGKYSSSIQFNKTQQVWQWRDKKDNTGYAIRN